MAKKSKLRKKNASKQPWLSMPNDAKHLKLLATIPNWQNYHVMLHPCVFIGATHLTVDHMLTYVSSACRALTFVA